MIIKFPLFYFQTYIEGLLAYECTKVFPGDRFGVYLEETPGAVAYTFDALSPTALGHTLANISNTVPIGDSVVFDSLTFPYDFSIAAYVDAGDLFLSQTPHSPLYSLLAVGKDQSWNQQFPAHEHWGRFNINERHGLLYESTV